VHPHSPHCASSLCAQLRPLLHECVTNECVTDECRGVGDCECVTHVTPGLCLTHDSVGDADCVTYHCVTYGSRILPDHLHRVPSRHFVARPRRVASLLRLPVPTEAAA